MDKLISSDKAIDSLKEKIKDSVFEEIKRVILDLPAEEAEKIKHAKWIRLTPGNYSYACTNCLNIVVYLNDRCGYCGAHMEGLEEGAMFDTIL